MEDSSQLRTIVAMTFHEFYFLACSMLLLSLPVSAQDLPAGTALEARLSGATGSRISHRGDPIEATIIAPVSVQVHRAAAIFPHEASSESRKQCTPTCRQGGLGLRRQDKQSSQVKEHSPERADEMRKCLQTNP